MILFAENCSWKAGPYLAKRMCNNEFKEVERGFVFVDEKCRGKRISEKLISTASEYAYNCGYENVYILSGEKGLYEKYGFKKSVI